MTKRKYAGTWTAIVTPFKKAADNQEPIVDEETLRRLVRRQAENGVTGVVPVGTTGESPTTSAEEDQKIFEIVVDEVRKIASEGGSKIMVMAGTGSNCTREAVEHTEAAKKAGADCCLVVTPYYNKPTPAGLKLHFKAVADVGLPVIVYNIKGRCGINIDTDTLMEIAQHEMVVGVKEASGDLEQMKEVIKRRDKMADANGKEFTVLSGDDGITLDLIKLGGDGVISVASNVVPDKVSEMVEYALLGNMTEAEKMNEHLAKLFKDIFVETNPVPVKYCVSRMGFCELLYRLPMCEPTEKSKEYLDEMLHEYNLIQ